MIWFCSTCKLGGFGFDHVSLSDGHQHELRERVLKEGLLLMSYFFDRYSFGVQSHEFNHRALDSQRKQVLVKALVANELHYV